MHEYKVGQVYKMKKPFTSTGTDAKERYFICLGKSSVFDMPIYLFTCTTTTKKESYRGKEKVCIEFEYSEELFTQPCLICLDRIFENMTVAEFEFYEPIFIGIFRLKNFVRLKRNLNLRIFLQKSKKIFLIVMHWTELSKLNYRLFLS